MATQTLSPATVKAATSEGAAIRRLNDGGGLSLWIYLDGRKYWRLRYVFEGKEKMLSLGVYPRIGLADARARRDAAFKQLDSGIDPSAARRAAKAPVKEVDDTFFLVGEEWYGKQVGGWVASHALDVRRRLDANLYPALGHLRISEIDAPTLLACVRKLEARGAHDLGHRVLSMSGQVFRYGIATGRCTVDPSAFLKGALTPAKKKNQNAVSIKEFPALLRDIARYDQIGETQTMLGLKMLALTFVRTSELIGATWSEIDLDAALWTIPAARMKMKREHMVPLSKQALAILRELKGSAGDSVYVLPSKVAKGPISNNTLLFALYGLGYRGRMTGHGFRAVASTFMNEAGINSDWIEMQLAHAPANAVRSSYNRAAYLPDRTKMMQYWADQIDSWTLNNVVALSAA